MLQRLLAPGGLSVRRAPVRSGFLVTSRSGRTARASSIDEIWSAVRQLTGRDVDPLGPPFLPADGTAAP